MYFCQNLTSRIWAASCKCIPNVGIVCYWLARVPYLFIRSLSLSLPLSVDHSLTLSSLSLSYLLSCLKTLIGTKHSLSHLDTFRIFPQSGHFRLFSQATRTIRQKPFVLTCCVQFKELFIWFAFCMKSDGSCRRAHFPSNFIQSIAYVHHSFSHLSHNVNAFKSGIDTNVVVASDIVAIW